MYPSHMAIWSHTSPLHKVAFLFKDLLLQSRHSFPQNPILPSYIPLISTRLQSSLFRPSWNPLSQAYTKNSLIPSHLQFKNPHIHSKSSLFSYPRLKSRSLPQPRPQSSPFPRPRLQHQDQKKFQQVVYLISSSGITFHLSKEKTHGLSSPHFFFPSTYLIHSSSPSPDANKRNHINSNKTIYHHRRSFSSPPAKRVKVSPPQMHLLTSEPGDTCTPTGIVRSREVPHIRF